VLVDEDLPPRLALALAAELGEEIRCSSVRDQGWRGLKNGELLARMVEHGFTILVTADRNMAHQQPLARLNLAAVVVTRPLQRAAVLARVTAIAAAVRAVPSGTSVEVPLSEKSRE
jgi:predicted nuclease of predicted toxin-antitoxin system